jgi:hypothetical protein
MTLPNQTPASKPDLLALATRFARLPDAQRKVFIARLLEAGIDFRMLPIPPRARTEDGEGVPASYAQTRLWLHARMIDEPAAYHITERIRLDGPLDANALRLSCDALIARHEALRTTFAEGADGVLQTVHAPMRCPWRMTDLSALPARERDTRAHALAHADETQAFDLTHAPLMRAQLLRLDAGTHWLSLTTHHIVSDGWSAGIALTELASFYRAFALGEAVTLAPLPIQYADFALWQRRWLDAGERDAQLDYWRARLDPSRNAARGVRVMCFVSMPRSRNVYARSPGCVAPRPLPCCWRRSMRCSRVHRATRIFRSACPRRIANAARRRG